MYQEQREEVILYIWNTVRCSSYVSGTQGGLIIRNTGRSSYISGTQGGGLIYQGHIEEVSDIRILLLSVE